MSGRLERNKQAAAQAYVKIANRRGLKVPARIQKLAAIEPRESKE